MKALSLMNFLDSFGISNRTTLFQQELEWLFKKTGAKPPEALFISYGYNGPDYAAYFQSVKNIFDLLKIKFIDIKDVDPVSSIASAKMFVVGGGDITQLTDKLNSLITATFNPYVAIRKMLEGGVPYLGWNEGSGIVSPKYLKLPESHEFPSVGFPPHQIICNYDNSQANKDSIKRYLSNNVNVSKAICQVAKLREEGSSVRLEESGGGMIDSATAPYPTVIRFKIVGGQLDES